jgi:hypothetical protein
MLDRGVVQRSSLWVTIDPMSLSRIAWSATVVACVVGAVVLLVSGYQGYAALSVAVGASAAVNLR